LFGLGGDKNMKYRTISEIAALILKAATASNSYSNTPTNNSKAAGGGATKTKIMYKAFLSYTQLKEYLSLLKGCGLIEYSIAEQVYKTTEKANHFLQIYNQISDVVAATKQIEIS
jgi:predicted transcriptional regulator